MQSLHVVELAVHWSKLASVFLSGSYEYETKTYTCSGPFSVFFRAALQCVAMCQASLHERTTQRVIECAVLLRVSINGLALCVRLGCTLPVWIIRFGCALSLLLQTRLVVRVTLLGGWGSDPMNTLRMAQPSANRRKVGHLVGCRVWPKSLLPNVCKSARS